MWGMRRPYSFSYCSRSMEEGQRANPGHGLVCLFDTYGRQCYHSHTESVTDEVFSSAKPLRSIADEGADSNHAGRVLASLFGGRKHSLVLFDSGDGDAPHGLGGGGDCLSWHYGLGPNEHPGDDFFSGSLVYADPDKQSLADPNSFADF